MLDFVPDTIIGIGWLDDLAVIIGLIWFFTSWLPRNRHRIYWFKPRPKAGTNARSEAGERAGRPGEAEFNPFEVLNVRRGASPGEIKRAYREMLSKYHPDKVVHLGEEFQRIAHDKVIEIKKAYEMLCGER
ncbi:MAG: DnaJ domain-containing protein [Candidatus Hydrogenedentota bacterium]|nr:MAG: DnaJ domain-containing protein [Candidatus Hydrogenedentota bacterium]